MKNLYCIRDERAELWFPPYPASNDQDATRAFGALLQQRESMPAQHPGDFALYRVGAFDENAIGSPIGVDAAHLLWNGEALLRFYDEIRPARAELVNPAIRDQIEIPTSDGV